MSDWWSKKLAGEKPSVNRANLPPVQVPMNFPQSQAQPMQSPAHVQNPSVPMTSQEQPASFSEALRMGITNGGEAMRKDGNVTCPDCGSAYVFSRARGNTQNGASPAPRCYECGWNGLYDQASQSSWTR
jgi:predicted RNA-binding Zn-ribbon protein involved in translation (DUF1610 family)